MDRKIIMSELSVEDFTLALIKGNDYTRLVYDEDFHCCIPIDYHVEFDMFDVYDYMGRKTAGYQKDIARLLIEQMEEYSSNNIVNIIEQRGPEEGCDGDYIMVDGTNKDYLRLAIVYLKARVGINDVANSFPKELDTDEAKRFFEKAINLGLMDANYKWLKGLQLLAYFASIMSEKLHLGKGTNSDGRPRVSWKPFERLFNQPSGRLRSNLNDIQKTGVEPCESSLVKKIFL